MALSDDQRTRYARHLLLPEQAEAGQERLLMGRVQYPAHGDEGAKAVARDYLERAGVVEGTDNAVAVAVPDARGIEALSGSPELREAARALAGAFAAVEAIKALAGIGTRGSLDEALSLATASTTAFAREQNSEEV